VSFTVETPRPRTNQPSGLCEFFENSARRWPEAIAVDVPPATGRPQRTTLTYAELKQESDLLAGMLHRVAGQGGVTAIMLNRTTERLYVAQLAVLRSASAYVCVDPSFPDDQLSHILSDSSAGVLLTDTAGAERAERIGYRGPVISVDRPLDPTPAPLPAPPAPEDTAYIIYTSGSTGRPKGVLISHEGIANLVGGDLTEFGLGMDDRVAQGSSAAYDSSVEEVWLALAAGATVVPMDDETARLGPDLVPWLRDERITVLCPPPTLLRATGCADPQSELPLLRLLYVGGEALPEDVAERWSRGRRMVNGYGPTECTVTCLRHDITPGQPVAIGRPVPGMRAWVLDENLEPVPDGEKGELCMGGTGLATGYLNQPELSSSKFLQHPRFGRVYRTGDLVHVEADGTCYYHGRIDSQVKLRGYRIELEAVESCLARCEGIREAACRVQGEGAMEMLAAHVVLDDPTQPPVVDDLKHQLRDSLPPYMVPGAFGTIGELPRNASGKLNRRDLPVLAIRTSQPPQSGPPPQDPVARSIAGAVQRVLDLPHLPAADDDFFTVLGGSSLSAAMLVTELRTDPATASITVRDLYETRTISQLAHRAAPPNNDPGESAPEHSGGHPIGATVVQSAWLLLELLAGSVMAYFVFFWILPWLSDRISLITLIVVAPVLLSVARLAFTPLSIALAVQAKKTLIGTYEPVRAPVWSGFHVRLWMVRQFMRFVPWGSIAGTEFACIVLRSLGAKIGRRVHIHRGVNLQQGGWDLLEIGDDVTISQDAEVGLVHLDAGQVVLGSVTLAEGSTVDIRAGMGPNTRVGRNAWLSALAYLPAGGEVPDGERWDGVPAKPAGAATEPPELTQHGRQLSPIVHGLATMLSRDLLSLALSLPFTLITIVIVARFGLTYRSLLSALEHPLQNLPLLVTAGVSTCAGLVLMVALEAVAAQILGPVPVGVVSRWSTAYIRVWLKSGLVNSAGNWLSGGLFWPIWLRAAGMRIGRGCEISTIIDVVPELVRIEEDTFFADGIYLGGPRIQRGMVSLAEVELSTNTFLGNHAVVAAGQHLPPDILIGISTVADDRVVTPGSSWFGHPPFELPRREIVTVDRSLTHEPPMIRVVNRIFWEWLRFTLPLAPLLAFTFWTVGVVQVATVLPFLPFLLLGVPAVSLATAASLCLFVLVLKWSLLGRVREGIHPLWSCWCSRWDFLYVAWGFIAGRPLSGLEGTLLLPLYLRRMGVKIGKRVALGEGFAQIVDPDMLSFGDGATVNAMFQAHTFEDRVLKIGHVEVGAHATLGTATVPLYGAVVGERTSVMPHSVVMKREHLQAGLRYAGAPTRRQDQDSAEPAKVRRRSLGGLLWSVQPAFIGFGKHRVPRRSTSQG
jgi:non-ribosomal peptide synthetase-like protein